MVEAKDIEKFRSKVNSIVKERNLDLSSDEDLSIGIMNLISIEEHLFYTANKTGKDEYYVMLGEIREMRKSLLQEIIKDPKGEEWCISKHLLASSMRLMEVGTKELGKGNMEKAKDLFKKSYYLYNKFWMINLKLVSEEKGKPAANVSDSIVLFYDEKCEHCKILNSYIAENDVDAILGVVHKEVTSIPENQADMERIHKVCAANVDLLVPFVYSREKCYTGEDSIIRMLHDRLKEKKIDENAPEKFKVEIKSTADRSQKELEAAIDCCKE